jgi:type IV pilus assembly protein PilA
MQQGFTLIELIIAIAIIAILASLAIPSYTQYTTRAHYAEVVMAAQPVKIGVEQCYQIRRSLADCDGGSFGVPADRTGVAGAVESIKTVNGVITITPDAANGILATDTYLLTPTAASPLSWATSGGGVDNGYAN